MKVVWALVTALVLTGVAGTASAVTDPAATRSPETDAATAAGVAAPQGPRVQYADNAAPHGFFWQILTPQEVLPGSFLFASGGSRKSTGKGTRSDREFFEISRTGDNDVPEAALRAYKNAAKAMATSDPGCQISWTLLAAIGRVESNHGRFGGSALGSDGVSRPAIVGPRLDGAGPFAAIADSEDGRLDGDKAWDRAVGPMQFLPTTWASVARDGDGDGTENPGDLDDAALGSAAYLCGAGGDLSTDAGMARAAFRYNHSDYYVSLVLSFAHGFATGVFVEPSPPPPPGQDNKAAAVQQAATTEKKKSSSTTKPTTSTAPKPSTSPKPSPSGTPTPRPTPTQPTATPPVTGFFTGTLRDGFRLDGEGDLAFPGGMLDDPAARDLDGDGSGTGDVPVETLRQELNGLLGETVKVHGTKDGGTLTVDEVLGRP